MKLNASKLQILCIRNKNVPLPERHLKDTEGKDLKYVQDVTFLGITWNEFFNHDKLLDSTIAKAKRAFYMLQRVIISRNMEIHLMGYKTIELGIIQYSCRILGDMTASQRRRLENCQRAMIRWIYTG